MSGGVVEDEPGGVVDALRSRYPAIFIVSRVGAWTFVGGVFGLVIGRRIGPWLGVDGSMSILFLVAALGFVGGAVGYRVSREISL